MCFSTNLPLWQYNGTAGFAVSDTLKPSAGFYFANTRSLAALNIPYSPSSEAATAIEDDPTHWQVRVTLTAGEYVDKMNAFGVASTAHAGPDALDFRKPRALADFPSVVFHRPDWGEQYGALATDIRPGIVASERWEFEVRTPEHHAAQLTFSSITKIPAWCEIYLIDHDRAATLNLREDSLYHFTPAIEISELTVVVGRKDAVQEQLRAVTLPKEFALGQNYPNPFNPETVIPIAIPGSSEIGLVIYNMLGRKVKTIYSGVLPAGRYRFHWEGKDDGGHPVTTGVYFYRLRTSTNVALMGKMLLIR